jgi:hypothetical protein
MAVGIATAEGSLVYGIVRGVLLASIALASSVTVLLAIAGVLAAMTATTAPGRWLVLSLHGLDRQDRQKQANNGTPPRWCRLFVRLVFTAPVPGLRVLMISTLTCSAGFVVAFFPAARDGIGADRWPWQLLTGLLLGLVPVLAARGVRLRHSTDRSIGGGATLYGTIAIALLIAGMAGLNADADSTPLFIWCAGVFGTGTYEVLLRAQSGVRLMTVPMGFERRLRLVPAGSPDEVSCAYVEHYWPYDPHVSDGPTHEALDSWDVACPAFDWGRRSTGTETLARAMLATFWGINDPHPSAVRRIMGCLLLSLEPDTEHVIEFADLIDAGLTAHADFEAGRFDSAPRPRGRDTAVFGPA